MLAVPVVVAALAMVRTATLQRRLQHSGHSGVTARQQWSFWLGIAAIDVAVGGAASPLASRHPVTAHVVQYVLIALVGVPSILVSLPEWWVRQRVAALRLYRIAGRTSRPLVAGVLANAVLLVTMLPWTMRAPGAGAATSTLLVVMWIAGGIVLWLPVVTPLTEHRLPSVPLRCAYLFGAAGLTPMLPGELLLSSRWSRPGGATLADEHLAGLLLHVAAVPVVWLVITTMWLKWTRAERAVDVSRRVHPSVVRGAGSIRWRIDPAA